MSKKRIIIHVSDGKISHDPDDILITYSLGSCIGVCFYDPATHIAGMLHYQLPNSSLDTQRAKDKPYMFADTGIKLILEKMESMGAKRKRMQVKLAGGASMDAGPKGFDIGKRNHMAIRKIMWKNGMFVDAEDVGGSSPRNMYMNVGTGEITIRSGILEKAL